MQEAAPLLTSAPLPSSPEAAFGFRVLDNTRDLKDAYKLRYQVYCLERNFLNGGNYPTRLEKDHFDKHSIHIGGKDKAGNLAGTVRLVLPSRSGLPFQQHCELFDDYKYLFDPANPFLATCAEISRLGISKSYRRRRDDGMYGTGSSTDEGAAAREAQRKFGHHRKRPEIVLGLYKTLYQESKRRGITHWVAAMEKSLLALLRRLDFNFQPIGPEIDYYGPVTLFMANISDMEKRVFSSKPHIFREFMEGLEPRFRPTIANG